MTGRELTHPFRSGHALLADATIRVGTSVAKLSKKLCDTFFTGHAAHCHCNMPSSMPAYVG